MEAPSRPRAERAVGEHPSSRSILCFGLSLPRERVEGFEPTEVAVPVVDASGTGGVKGKRPSKKDKLRAAAALAAARGETPEKND